MLLVCVEIILSDENKIAKAYKVLAVVIYQGKIYPNSLTANLPWVSISQDRKVTPTFETSVQANKLQNTQNSQTFWHANQIANMLETQRYIFFLSFHFNSLFIFPTSTAIKSYFFYKCLIVGMLNKDHKPNPMPTVSLSLLQNVSYFLDKNQYFD